MMREVYVEPALDWAASEAVAAFDWSGVTPEERERVLESVRMPHHGGAPVSWWLGEIRRLLREHRGAPSKIIPGVVVDDFSAPTMPKINPRRSR